MLRLIASQMKEQLRTTLSIRGFSPADYNVLAYGGAGPLLLALFTEGLPFRGVATVPWAAGFSAFGAATVDLMHRYEKSADIVIPQGADDSWKVKMGQATNAIWDELETQARDDFAEEGLADDQVVFKPIAFVRYGAQMEDLEVRSPVARISSAADMDHLLDVFEKQYEHNYAGVAKHERAGFEIFDLGLEASLPKAKPKLVRRSLVGREPDVRSIKGERKSTSTAIGKPPLFITWTRCSLATRWPAPRSSKQLRRLISFRADARSAWTTCRFFGSVERRRRTYDAHYCNGSGRRGKPVFPTRYRQQRNNPEANAGRKPGCL